MIEARVGVYLSVVITVNDESAITRCTENVDGWRDNYYSLTTRDEVLDHWAFNCAVNGVEQVNRLDGWADLSEDAVCMMIDRRDVDVSDIEIEPCDVSEVRPDQWRAASDVLRRFAGPNLEPLACGYVRLHDGPHAWAKLPTFTPTDAEAET